MIWIDSMTIENGQILEPKLLEKFPFLERLEEDSIYHDSYILDFYRFYYSNQFLLDLYLIHARYFIFTCGILFMELLLINFY